MTNRVAANRYARALLEVALSERNDLRQVEQQLADFLALVHTYPALHEALLNPVVPSPRKRNLIAALVARAQFAPVVAKLLALLAERDRIVLLPDLLEAYRDRLLDHLKIVRADVTTATPMSTDRAQALERRLTELTGRTVTLATAVDPTIIGGVVARIGSTVYDGSVTRQLQRIKERLVEGM